MVAEMLYSLSNKQVLPYDVTKYVEEVVMMWMRLIMHDPWRDEIAGAGIAIGMIHRNTPSAVKGQYCFIFLSFYNFPHDCHNFACWEGTM